MTAVLVQIATAFGTLVGLGLVWFGLQAFIRRFFPSMAAGGEDPFRSRFGCGGCAGESCDTEEPARTR
jgi:hypothetical protein